MKALVYHWPATEAREDVDRPSLVVVDQAGPVDVFPAP